MKLKKEFFTTSTEHETGCPVPSLFFRVHNRGTFQSDTKYSLTNVRSPYYCICHVFAGSATVMLNTPADPQNHTLNSGSTILIASDITFGLAVEDRSEISCLLFSGQLTISYFPDDSFSDRYLFIHQTLPSYSNQLSLLLQERSAGPQPDLLPDARIFWEQNELTCLLTHLRTSAQLPANHKALSAPAYLKKIRQYLDEHYALSFHLEETAKLSGVSKYKICHDFTYYYGQSPLKYVNEVRILNAKKFLHTLDIPVHEIGSMVGIDNTNHFINLFKRHTGMTPHIYRQTCQ